jgi:trigger factor
VLGQAAPELNEALKGTLAGEDRTVQMAFPEGHQIEAIRGKTAQMQVHIKRVDEPILPEVDEEFCRAYGVEEGGVDALRVEVRKSMEEELERIVHSRLRSQVIDRLLENTVEVPPSMIEAEMMRLHADSSQRTQDPSKAPQPEMFRPAAQRRTALSLLMGQIVQNESMRPDQAKVQERVLEVAAGYKDPADTRKRILANRQVMDQISSQVLEEQIIDWVIAHAQITDKPATFSEVTGFGRGQQSPAEISENPS